jgi:zinc protease
MKRFVAFVAVAVALAVPAYAQGPGVALDTKIEIPSKTLENGLQVLVIPDNSVPLVTIEIAVRNGAYTEPAEHMFFKANEKVASQALYLKRQRELGMVWNGTTSAERVNYYFTLGSDNLEEGMVFMRDAIRTPIFKEEELVKERQVVIGELERNQSNPYFHFGRAVDALLWWKYPTRKDTIGDRETIETASVEKMRIVQKKFYIPNNSLLILAGDVEPDVGFALAEKLFGDWERGTDPFALDPIPAHPPIKASEAVVVIKPVQVVSGKMAFHGPSVRKDPKATYAADVFSFILGQKNSRFQKALVDSGLTLGAGISYLTLNQTGPINISFASTPDKLDAAVVALQEEVSHFADPDYFTDEQIQTAKTVLAVDHIYGQEKMSGYAHTVSFWWAVAGLDYYTDYVDALQRVTREDMQKYVRDYILGKDFVFGFILSEEAQTASGLTAEKASSWAKPVSAKTGGR